MDTMLTATVSAAVSYAAAGLVRWGVGATLLLSLAWVMAGILRRAR